MLIADKQGFIVQVCEFFINWWISDWRIDGFANLLIRNLTN